MPNIMLTDVCNLQCPYCFANEFVNHNRNDITIDTFKQALNFAATDKSSKLGLIGGEPTLHPQFREILQILIDDQRFNNIIIYTNGIRIGEFAKELSHPKFKMLINCNSENDIGSVAYKKIVDNLELLIHDYYMKEKITLGFNLYKPDFEYDYIMNLLRHYDLHSVRISVVVPNDAQKRNFDVTSYFSSIKPRLIEFFHSALCEHIIPWFDCNKIPSCLITNKERELLFKLYERLPEKYRSSGDFFRDTSIFTSTVTCSPVVDILQDLSAVRCFGLSSYTRVNIKDFSTLTDLKNYYSKTIDALAIQFGICDDCKDCYRGKTMLCTGGCLAYKMRKVEKINECIDHISSEG